jgi:beta-glucanase (GH16 family)
MLKILTMNEKKAASAWETKIGFISKNFDFTSGILNSGESFQQQFGLIKVKLRIAGSKDISHACWLGADGKLPHVNLFHFNGKNIVVNNYAQEGASVAVVKETVKGISPTDFYIYSLEWNQSELIWKVNNVEVFKTSKAVPQESMFLAFNSFISEQQKGGQGSLDVDWIRVYKK